MSESRQAVPFWNWDVGASMKDYILKRGLIEKCSPLQTYRPLHAGAAK